MRHLTLSRRARSRGVTLIEVMITVAIIGILAVVAVVAYRRKVTATKMAEATHMIENIRASEESYKAEIGNYADVSTALGSPNLYPAATPGKFTTAWGGTCTTCKTGVDWSLINVQPDGPLQFGYSVVAGNGSTPPGSKGVNISINGSTVNLAALAGANWYVVEAQGDTNGDGVFCTVVGTSASGDLWVENEGE